MLLQRCFKMMGKVGVASRFNLYFYCCRYGQEHMSGITWTFKGLIFEEHEEMCSTSSTLL